MLNHSKSCIEVRTKYEFNRHWFFIANPHHCSECGGNGGHWSDYDPSAGEISLSPGRMLEFEYCESCVLEDHCPLCNEKLSWIDESSIEPDQLEYPKCYHCGWEDNGDNAGLPSEDVLECECHEVSTGMRKPFRYEDLIESLTGVYREAADLYESA